MSRRQLPRLKDGDELEPWHLNVIYAELERLNKMRGSGSIVVQNRDGGPLIMSTDATGAGDRWATLPGGGIAGGGSGTITYVTDSTTATAKNKWTTAAPASKKCLVGTDEYGDLVVKSWDC